MRNFLLFCFYLTSVFGAFAQAPTIEGDTMLCPSYDSYGTATVTNGVTYDSYQWYFRYVFFAPPEFNAIEGATSASFTYDWYTYDVSEIKLVVTKGGQTFESNVIMIDSYNWSSLLVSHEFSEGIMMNTDTGEYYICEGDIISNTVLPPYTNVQWYKDDEPIEGATEVTYVINEPGVYYVIASPEICPNVTSKLPAIVVHANLNCDIENIVPVVQGKTTLCANEEATATLTNGLEYDEYYWQVKTSDVDYYVEIEGGNNPTFTYSAADYAGATLRFVGKLNDLYYMSNELLIEVDEDCTAGVNNPDAAAFSLYPNPANSVLNIALSNSAVAESYVIYDVAGKTLLTGSLDKSSTVNIQNLAAGSYLIKVSAQGATSTKMFVKQ